MAIVGLGTQESHGAAPYPPGTWSHSGGRLFPAGLVRAEVRAAPYSAKASLRDTLPVSGTYVFFPLPPATPLFTTSGGAPLKSRRPATSVLLAESGERRLGTAVWRFLWSRSSYKRPFPAAGGLESARGSLRPEN